MLKIDTHRHAGGSIPVQFVWETIQKLGLKHLAECEADVQSQMTFAPDEPRDFHRFLDKFRILDNIPWTEQLIDDSVKSICDGLDKEQIDYAWLDFSINKYMGIGWHKHEAIKFIYDSFNKYRPNGVGLILSLKYESTKVSQKQYAKLIEHEVASKCLIGIDLVGNEAYFSGDFYRSIFRDWNNIGKMTRAHVGESQEVGNIKSAILDLEVTNIAHGFKVIYDSEAISIARERGVTFDLALTSNDLTGVWPSRCLHPISSMLYSGLKVTIGTDDPVICNSTLDNEYIIAKSNGVEDKQIEFMSSVAADNTLRVQKT